MGATTQAGANPPGQQRGGLGAQAANPNGTPSSATPFQQRLLNLVNRAGAPGGGGSQEPIQIFGMAKIIADQRANSLLVFATKPDMDAITNVIAKLDVLLAQVLIESVIIDYSLGPDTLKYGVSAAQNPKTIPGSDPKVTTGGAVNNGPSLLNLLSASSLTNSVFGNNLAAA